MRHHNTTKKFGMETGPRRALMRSMALNLILKEKIETTEAKAKSTRAYVEKLVTRAKVDSVSNRRLLSARLGGGSDAAVKKLVEVIAPRYKDVSGGYTRVVKTRTRIGSDGAEMAVIEFVKN